MKNSAARWIPWPRRPQTKLLPSSWGYLDSVWGAPLLQFPPIPRPLPSLGPRSSPSALPVLSQIPSPLVSPLATPPPPRPCVGPGNSYFMRLEILAATMHSRKILHKKYSEKTERREEI